MKKNSTDPLKWLLFILLVFCSYISGIAQSGNVISISVNGIEYDDPGFSLLKESLRKNKNVTSLKPGYDQGTAKLSLSYNRKAQDLWDELPQTTKQFFKLTTIDDNHIVLENKMAAKETTATKTTSASNTNKNDDDCKNCYFNLCKYDGIKTFQGVVYKQINKDDGTYYYNCDNGILVQKRVFQNGYGVITSITSDTLLRFNVPVGTTWGEFKNENNFLGMNFKTSNVYKMAAKGINLTVSGTTYHDVIMINYAGRTDDNTFGNSSFSKNYYYAKGVGLIKTEDGDLSSVPKFTAKETEEDKKETTTLDALIKTMKGRIDETITGTWKFHDKEMNWDTYYVFNSDGSYQYYVGSVTPVNLMSDPKSYWRFDGTHLELAGGGWDKVYRYELQKKNDPATGKPALVIEWKGTERRAYISENGKAPW